MTLSQQQIVAFGIKFDLLAREGEDQKIVDLVSQLSDEHRQLLLEDDDREAIATAAYDRIQRQEVARQEVARQEVAKKDDLQPLSVAKAATILENKLRRPEAASALRGVYRAVKGEEVDDLLDILEALSGLRTYGRLQATLWGVAERVSSILLIFMIERFEEANILFEEAWQSQGVGRTGLINHAKSVRQDGKIFFPPAGLQAIERLIRQGNLPDKVEGLVSTEFLEEIQTEEKPTTALLRKLSVRPEKKFDRSENPGPMRAGKTAKKKAADPQRDIHVVERREERHKAQPEGIQGQQHKSSFSKAGKRAAGDPNARSKKGKKRK